jgi:hypothetical protein
MREQQLEYIRETISLALANLQRSGKGQLAAFEDSPLARTNRYNRKRHRTVELDNRKVCALTDPLPCSETRNRKNSPPLIEPVIFATASWRRAVLAQEDHCKAWLLWCYAHDLNFEHQVAIVRWVWTEFERKAKGKRIAIKTMERLRQLVWLAAQDVKAMLLGFPLYEQQELARLVGVDKKNWSKNYADYWLRMTSAIFELDRNSLIGSEVTRSQQKEASFNHYLQK